MMQGLDGLAARYFVIEFDQSSVAVGQAFVFGVYAIVIIYE